MFLIEIEKVALASFVPFGDMEITVLFTTTSILELKTT